jgi:DNA-binding GntR family transcriptional regulator
VKGVLVESLRGEIILGGLVPGQYLRLEEIAERYDVSTMPVREALRDLEAEGLVTIFPHRGAVVTELSADDLEDIYEVRAVLEAMAARLAVPRMTGVTLDEIEQLADQIDNHMGDVVALVELNHRFHSSLYAASGRRHLQDLIRMLRYRTQHYLRAYVADLGGMTMAQQEHRVIVEACRQGDAEKAGAVMEKHVRQVGRSLINHFYYREED